MRWLHVLTAVSLLLVPSISRAQYVPAPPLGTPTNPPAPEPTPQPIPEPTPPPTPRPAPDTEEPPPPSHHAGLPTAGQWRAPAGEEPVNAAGFALEIDTSGFASGKLDGGLVIGAHGADGSLLGFRFDYTDTTQKEGSTSRSNTAYALGLTGRLSVFGNRNGLDLALGLDAALIKAEIGSADAVSGASGSSTNLSGFQLGFGPMIRYWIRPNLALGYLVQARYESLSSDTADVSGSKPEQNATAIVGTFTLTAAL
jgi:hypothetical protein